MTLTTQLRELISAGFSGLWLQTFEPNEAQLEILRLCNKQGWKLWAWDAANGPYDAQNNQPLSQEAVPSTPLKLLPATDEETNVLLLHNYHKFLNNPTFAQLLANKIVEGKAIKNTIIVLAPIMQIPIELEKLFTVVEHPLPTHDDLGNIAVEVHSKASSDQAFVAADASQGMTRMEAENAFALSMTRHGKLDPESIWELKTRALKKSGLLSLYRGKTKFSDLGGLQAVKDFAKKSIGCQDPKPKGILLLGPSGTGKSAFAKALGDETGRPVLIADPGSWKGSLVGETGRKTRQALQIADSMAPCVLFIDEVEKALAGAGSAHQGDNGVSADQLGTMLTWLNDHTSDVYVVCTSNDISKLPPEFSRAERFDGIFFLDLPSKDERKLIWNIYGWHYDIATEDDFATLAQAEIDDEGWTGAEIKACCRLTSMLGVTTPEASNYIVPVSRSSSDKVAALRNWADGKCLSASEPGVFRKESKPKTAYRRSFANVSA